MKTQNYRVKCYHQIHKSTHGMHKINVDVEENEKDFSSDARGGKYSRNELVFIAQIYMVKNYELI